MGASRIRKMRDRYLVVVAIVTCVYGLTCFWFDGHISDDKEAEDWCHLGERYQHANDDKHAIEAFSHSLDLRPDARTYRFRAYSHWRLMNMVSCDRDLLAAAELAHEIHPAGFTDAAGTSGSSTTSP